MTAFRRNRRPFSSECASDGEKHQQRCQIPHAIWHSRTGPHRISAQKSRNSPNSV
jgi:hypothetical protein